jgi:hypothetical protein
MSVLQVSMMLQWLKIKRSKLPTNTILSIALAILIVTPAQADIVPDQPEKPSCIEVVNLEKYPDYQIFARTRIWHRLPIENDYFKDIILKPGMCLSSGRREKIDFYATKKTNLNPINLVSEPGTEQLKGLKSLQTQLILGKDISTPNNSSPPFYTELIQRKVQITELNENTYKFNTQQYVYSINSNWAFLLMAGLLLMIIVIVLHSRYKTSLQRDLK